MLDVTYEEVKKKLSDKLGMDTVMGDDEFTEAQHRGEYDELLRELMREAEYTPKVSK
jgi:hypothetical protein